MPLEIVFGPRAERDLDEIDDLLADYSLTAAETLTRLIEDRCAWLAEFPRAGVERSETGANVRSFAIPRQATVLCRFDGRELTVLRILYAGSDVDRALSAEDGL